MATKDTEKTEALTGDFEQDIKRPKAVIKDILSMLELLSQRGGKTGKSFEGMYNIIKDVSSLKLSKEQIEKLTGVLYGYGQTMADISNKGETWNTINNALAYTMNMRLRGVLENLMRDFTEVRKEGSKTNAVIKAIIGNIVKYGRMYLGIHTFRKSFLMTAHLQDEAVELTELTDKYKNVFEARRALIKFFNQIPIYAENAVKVLGELWKSGFTGGKEKAEEFAMGIAKIFQAVKYLNNEVLVKGAVGFEKVGLSIHAYQTIVGNLIQLKRHAQATTEQINRALQDAVENHATLASIAKEQHKNLVEVVSDYNRASIAANKLGKGGNELFQQMFKAYRTKDYAVLMDLFGPKLGKMVTVTIDQMRKGGKGFTETFDAMLKTIMRSGNFNEALLKHLGFDVSTEQIKRFRLQYDRFMKSAKHIDFEAGAEHFEEAVHKYEKTWEAFNKNFVNQFKGAFLTVGTYLLDFFNKHKETINKFLHTISGFIKNHPIVTMLAGGALTFGSGSLIKTLFSKIFGGFFGKGVSDNTKKTATNTGRIYRLLLRGGMFEGGAITKLRGAILSRLGIDSFKSMFTASLPAMFSNLFGGGMIGSIAGIVGPIVMVILGSIAVYTIVSKIFKFFGWDKKIEEASAKFFNDVERERKKITGFYEKERVAKQEKVYLDVHKGDIIKWKNELVKAGLISSGEKYGLGESLSKIWQAKQMGLNGTENLTNKEMVIIARKMENERWGGKTYSAWDRGILTLYQLESYLPFLKKYSQKRAAEYIEREKLVTTEGRGPVTLNDVRQVIEIPEAKELSSSAQNLQISSDNLNKATDKLLALVNGIPTLNHSTQNQSLARSWGVP